jgi:sulfoxide reductase catalytic subunit YedY
MFIWIAWLVAEARGPGGIMLIKKTGWLKSSEITDEKLYRNRREFLKAAGIVAMSSASGMILPLGCTSPGAAASPAGRQKGKFDTTETKTPYEDVTTYNNYYEFGTGKDDPAKNAHTLKPRPWTIKVDGLVKAPKTWNLEDLLRGFTMEDRVYRMRCVEGWSMVIPWYGFPMADLINKLEPLPSARYVRMETLHDTAQMPGQSRGIFGYVLDWPYVEGLRMDEARNPLTLMAVGVYGKAGPNQNGAPIRLVTPWKYGFKGIKSIVRISFVDTQPVNTWQREWPQAYGFYANVNPSVAHPRYSQAKERRLGEFFPRNTLMFNGYSDQVASMYIGVDLRRNY